jgi:hypothetical protein
MAHLSKTRTASSHWYQADGTPVFRVRRAGNEGDRPTTLADARKLNLFPSVTGILGVLDKPGLEKWKIDQALETSLRLPKQEEESLDYWCRRVRSAASEQVGEAADLGTAVHAALEAAMVGEPYKEELSPYVRPVLEWKQSVAIEIVEREKRLVNVANGFAGTADVLFRFGEYGMGILDYKTRRTRPGDKVKAYDNQGMQLAAYAAAYWGPENLQRVLAANIFISTTEPGRIDVVKHEHLPRDWEAFRTVAELWRYQKGYDPRNGGGQ